MTILKVFAVVIITLVLIGTIGFVGIAASTVGGRQGNLSLAAGIGGILFILGGASYLIYKIVT